MKPKTAVNLIRSLLSKTEVFIISGPQGSGKTEMAKDISESLGKYKMIDAEKIPERVDFDFFRNNFIEDFDSIIIDACTYKYQIEHILFLLGNNKKWIYIGGNPFIKKYKFIFTTQIDQTFTYFPGLTVHRIKLKS